MQTSSPIDPSDLVPHITSLGNRHTLATSQDMRVMITDAQRSPEVVDEITRLRALSFGLAGAGAGQAQDRDRFDDYYLQMFIWHDVEQRIIGGYRLGFVDQIASEFGIGGLYTASLFDLAPSFVGLHGKAIELGRSFVVPDHQRSYSPLMLLWRAIARFVFDNPTYHTLLGSVGIHASYHTASQSLLIDFLRANHLNDALADQIRPKTPVQLLSRSKSQSTEGTSAASIEQLSRLVSEFEPDDKGVPVLIRQYLKIGAEFLGFHHDREFHSLACLLRVDLRETPVKTLGRYMGREEAVAYHTMHALNVPRTA